ncbi:protein of unknown function [Burkholderia multivorans]
MHRARALIMHRRVVAPAGGKQHAMQDRARPGSEVTQLVTQHIDDLSERIRELVEMRDAFLYLAEQGEGDSRPDCTILVELAWQTHRDRLRRGCHRCHRAPSTRAPCIRKSVRTIQASARRAA